MSGSIVPDKIYQTQGRPRICRAVDVNIWMMYDPNQPDDDVCFYGSWKDAVNEALRRSTR
jgi:hypothetical protein